MLQLRYFSYLFHDLSLSERSLLPDESFDEFDSLSGKRVGGSIPNEIAFIVRFFVLWCICTSFAILAESFYKKRVSSVLFVQRFNFRNGYSQFITNILKLHSLLFWHVIFSLILSKFNFEFIYHFGSNGRSFFDSVVDECSITDARHSVDVGRLRVYGKMSSVEDLTDFFDHADFFKIGEWTVF